MQGVFDLYGLLKRQWFGAARVAAYRDAALSRLVRHACLTVPYYRRLLDAAGVDPLGIRGIEDLPKIPVTDRRDLQSLPVSQILSSTVAEKDTVRTRTSGSTGVPLEIRSSRRERARVNPSFVRTYLSLGFKPWQRLMFFEARADERISPSWYERGGLLRRRRIHLEETADMWLQRLQLWRPDLLQGYALNLKLLAEHVLRKNAHVRVPFIVSTSGMLDDGGRKLLERAFGGSIMDVYASEEAGGVIAWECAACGAYHVSADTVIVELLVGERPVMPGECGEVVITALGNMTMPFIRYRQGDLAAMAARRPVCGREFPLLERIEGRQGDCVVLPDGTRLSPHVFFRVMDNQIGVGAWRIVQTQRHRLVVEIEKGARGTPIDWERIRKELGGLAGNALSVEVRHVAALRKSPCEKLRSVVCRADPAHRPP